MKKMKFKSQNNQLLTGIFKLIKVNSDAIPEPVGVVAAAVYLVVMFVFIPFPLYESVQP